MALINGKYMSGKHVVKHFSGENCYLCSEIKRKSIIMMTRKNERNTRTLEMLRYQAKHYQASGRGAMSQQINARIRRLLNQINADAVKA
jgi:hypothetical protein